MWQLANALLRNEAYVEAREKFEGYLKIAGARPERIKRVRSVHVPFLASHIGRLRVRAPAGMMVRVDGESLAFPNDTPRYITVGAHSVIVEGAASSPTMVTVRANETTVVVLEQVSKTVVAATPVSGSTTTPPSTVSSYSPDNKLNLAKTETIRGRGIASLSVAALSVVSGLGGAYFMVDAGRARARASDLGSANAGSPCLFYSSPTCSALLDAKQRDANGRAMARGFFVAAASFAVAAPVVWLAWPQRKITVIGWLAGPTGARFDLSVRF